VRDTDKAHVAEVAHALIEQGFKIFATRGTAGVLAEAKLAYSLVNKVTEGRPHIVDMIKNDEISLIVNTVESRQAITDSYAIRRAALQHKVSYTTTLAGAKAICLALKQLDACDVNCLQDLHQELKV
jgi:carbamoyl-phosphate synthase large subunit